MTHPDYDYCNCQDTWEHRQAVKDDETLPMKLSPDEWMQRTGIQIMDPDGWDRRNFTVSWGVKLTRDEFLVRAASSTCMAWPKPLYDEKWQNSPISLIPDPQAKDVETMSNNADTATSNPILDIINEILKPKTNPTIDTNLMLEAATQLHVMYEIFVKAGFTEAQALELVGRMLKS